VKYAEKSLEEESQVKEERFFTSAKIHFREVKTKKVSIPA